MSRYTDLIRVLLELPVHDDGFIDLTDNGRDQIVDALKRADARIAQLESAAVTLAEDLEAARKGPEYVYGVGQLTAPAVPIREGEKLLSVSQRTFSTYEYAARYVQAMRRLDEGMGARGGSNIDSVIRMEFIPAPIIETADDYYEAPEEDPDDWMTSQEAKDHPSMVRGD